MDYNSTLIQSSLDDFRELQVNNIPAKFLWIVDTAFLTGILFSRQSLSYETVVLTTGGLWEGIQVGKGARRCTPTDYQFSRMGCIE